MRSVPEPEVSVAIVKWEETCIFQKRSPDLKEKLSSRWGKNCWRGRRAKFQTRLSLAKKTIQEKYDRSLKKTRTDLGARLPPFANLLVDEEFWRIEEPFDHEWR